MKTKKKYDRFLFVGIVIELLLLLPSLILGGDGTVLIHDQLDIEVLSYILNARHLFDQSIPEFMIANKQALVPASYGTLVFYCLLSDEYAFVVNQAFVQIVAFLGLYLLLQELHIRKIIALTISILFSLLPFYSVFGLSVMGQPLLGWSVLKAYQGKKYTIFIAVFFALFSSPVLIGYADAGIFLIIAVILQIKKQREQALQIWKMFILLVLVYTILYFPLLIQVLNKSGFVSHRNEYVMSYTQTLGEWVNNFKSLWNEGQYHAASNHSSFIPWILGSLLVMVLLLPLLNDDGKQKLIVLAISTFVLFLITAFYASWKCSIVGRIRDALGGVFISFQADRFYWLFPILWYVAYGQALDVLLSFASLIRINFDLPKKLYKYSKVTSVILVTMLLLFAGAKQYSNSLIKTDLQYLIHGTPSLATTYNHFYSTDLFNEIRDYIGKSQDQYRVGSVALYPSIPLYNGFYCIDGYSTNYDIEYKHQFRAVIADELEKNKDIKIYYDGWGNRCYLFTSDIGKSYYFLKNSTRKINDLMFDASALKGLNCQYIISGLEIVEPEKSGLAFLHVFENENSPYRIWLYQVEDSV